MNGNVEHMDDWKHIDKADTASVYEAKAALLQAVAPNFSLEEALNILKANGFLHPRYESKDEMGDVVRYRCIVQGPDFHDVDAITAFNAILKAEQLERLLVDRRHQALDILRGHL